MKSKVLALLLSMLFLVPLQAYAASTFEVKCERDGSAITASSYKIIFAGKEQHEEQLNSNTPIGGFMNKVCTNEWPLLCKNSVKNGSMEACTIQPPLKCDQTRDKLCGNGVSCLDGVKACVLEAHRVSGPQQCGDKTYEYKVTSSSYFFGQGNKLIRGAQSVAPLAIGKDKTDWKEIDEVQSACAPDNKTVSFGSLQSAFYGRCVLDAATAKNQFKVARCPLVWPKKNAIQVLCKQEQPRQECRSLASLCGVTDMKEVEIVCAKNQCPGQNKFAKSDTECGTCSEGEVANETHTGCKKADKNQTGPGAQTPPGKQPGKDGNQCENGGSKNLGKPGQPCECGPGKKEVDGKCTPDSSGPSRDTTRGGNVRDPNVQQDCPKGQTRMPGGTSCVDSRAVAADEQCKARGGEMSRGQCVAKNAFQDRPSPQQNRPQGGGAGQQQKPQGGQQGGQQNPQQGGGDQGLMQKIMDMFKKQEQPKTPFQNPPTGQTTTEDGQTECTDFSLVDEDVLQDSKGYYIVPTNEPVRLKYSVTGGKKVSVSPSPKIPISIDRQAEEVEFTPEREGTFVFRIKIDSHFYTKDPCLPLKFKARHPKKEDDDGFR